MTPNIGAKLWCSVVFLLLKPHYFKLAASANITQCSHITKYVVTQKMKQELNIKNIKFSKQSTCMQKWPVLNENNINPRIVCTINNLKEACKNCKIMKNRY